jgi:hypothetical protein
MAFTVQHVTAWGRVSFVGQAIVSALGIIVLRFAQHMYAVALHCIPCIIPLTLGRGKGLFVGTF